MLAIYLSPVYIIVHIFCMLWFIRFFKSVHKVFQKRFMQVFIGLIYWFFALSMLIGFLLPHGALERFFKLLGNYFLGFTLYEVMILLVYSGIRFYKRHRRFANLALLDSARHLALSGLAAILVMASVCTYGIYNAHHIRDTYYNVTIKKPVAKFNKLDICLVSDLHMGFNIGVDQIAQMVKKINASHPDLVVIAGDIFDNEYSALEDDQKLIQLFQSISSKYGVYAVYGNHDIEEKILAGFTFDDGKKDEASPQMDAFLKKAHIHLLRDQGVLIDNSFYLFGRADAEKPGRGITVRKSPKQLTKGMNQNKPIIVLDHEPRQLAALSKAGVDLDLSGHTHDGQCFPANIVVSMLWPNSYGYLRKGTMHSIVTSGVGIFGPYMRVGTKAEICHVEVQFQ